MVCSHCPTLTTTPIPRLINCNSTQWHSCLGAVWTPPHNSIQPIFCRYRCRCRAVWKHHYTYIIGSSSLFSLLWDGNFDQFTGQKYWAWAPRFSKLPFSAFLAKLLCTSFTDVMGMANVIHNAINIIHNVQNLWFMTSFKQFMTLFKQLWMTLWKTQRVTIL